jgi:hypothetical protein
MALLVRRRVVSAVPPAWLIECAKEEALKANGVTSRELAKRTKQDELLCARALYSLMAQPGRPAVVVTAYEPYKGERDGDPIQVLRYSKPPNPLK